MNSLFDYRFVVSCGFTIVTLEDKNVTAVEYIENQSAQAFSGAGIQTASLIGSKNVNILVVGFLGPNAAMALKNVPDIKILSVQGDKQITVKEALDLYLDGKLSEIDSANVGAHHGMGGGGGGGGMGRGAGRGMGRGGGGGMGRGNGGCGRM